MNVPLMIHDVMGAWLHLLKIFIVPGVVLGAGLGWFVRRWISCPLVSYAAALALFYLVQGQHMFHRPLTAAEMALWAALLALPPILASVSAGYFGAHWLRSRRTSAVPPGGRA